MQPRADTRRLLNAVATLESAAAKFERVAEFTDDADAAAYRTWGPTTALDIRERIGFIENALVELRKVAETIERKSRQS